MISASPGAVQVERDTREAILPRWQSSVPPTVAILILLSLPWGNPPLTQHLTHPAPPGLALGGPGDPDHGKGTPSQQQPGRPQGGQGVKGPPCPGGRKTGMELSCLRALIAEPPLRALVSSCIKGGANLEDPKVLWSQCSP